MKKVLTILALGMTMIACSSSQDGLKEKFKSPPNQYRPMPFWHLNGHLTTGKIEKEVTEAKTLSGFGGVTVLPVSPRPQHPTGIPCPGMSPAYLSDEYFERYSDILRISEKQGTQVILYDDIDFPSGSVGGRLQREYPEYTRKLIKKYEVDIIGEKRIKEQCPDPKSIIMAVSAMNMNTKEIVDLQPYLDENNAIDWKSPKGKWKIMFFICEMNTNGVHGPLVDYMQPEAVSKLIEMTYGEYDKRYSQYFGNVITKTFFDDVGFVHQEETWTPAITRIFEEKYKKNPALYYPALYYDIGSETEAARVAFYDIRSELMAEGYVKQVSEWAAKRNLKSMGHPPENYSPNSVVAHGDILKYYRYAQIPLLDAIFYYGRGLNGFKQVSSAADLGDKPLVGAELCGAFSADMDSLAMYRTTIEAIVRGVNLVVPHGMWYDTDPKKVAIPPLIAPENPLLRDCLPRYSAYVGRACLLLQGGKHVSEIALLSPIASIQGGSYINRDAASGLPVANWVPEGVNHHQLSDLLTNQLRRDFTFIHPENLCNGKITANGQELRLNNATNIQDYKVLLLPGGDIISAATLKAIKKYYDGGGKVIATASLPFKSAEFGQDDIVKNIISEMFGVDASEKITADLSKSNSKGGQIKFIKAVTKENLSEAFNRMNIVADVQFDEVSIPKHEIGYVNYIHKQKDGKDYYYFTNTTEKEMDLTVYLRGAIKNIELWNPHTGNISTDVKAYKHKKDDIVLTAVDIRIPAVSSIFVIGNRK
ncbi:glycosyl hydrolase [Parabacteroides sp. Marseille-P3160]|uniref:glycosyl hydrolase n=1 Tax=Parabacteroides sp. Marseille-P3160 TaxID=1917887 RepID=UPI0013597D15|nr:glycosyl hydrolase [Parabacteroides sp. Marseille-P3160]